MNAGTNAMKKWLVSLASIDGNTFSNMDPVMYKLGK